MRYGLKGLVLALALAGHHDTVADMNINNINNPQGGVDENGDNGGAQSFFPATTEYLQSVTLNLLNGTGDSILVSIYSSTNDVPSSDLLTLGSITSVGVSGTYSNYTLNAPSTLQLVAGTQYWVVGMYAVNPTWAYTVYPFNTDSGTGTFGPLANYHAAGASPGWTAFALSTGPYMVAVTATSTLLRVRKVMHVPPLGISSLTKPTDAYRILQRALLS